MADRTEPRICPGRHSDTHPAGQLSPDEFLCRRCVGRAMAQLDNLATDLPDVELTITRQDVGGGLTSARGNGETPVVFNDRARRVRLEQLDVLRDWADWIKPLRTLGPGERPDSPQRIGEILRRLRSARPWMRGNDQAPTLADAIGDAHHAIRRLIDRRPERWFAGVCGAQITDVDVAATDGVLVPQVRARLCTRNLFARAGQTEIVCDGYGLPADDTGCGANHPALSRHKYALRTLRDAQLPLDAILDALPRLVGRDPEPATVRKWRERQRLVPVACSVRTGRELYLGGDVVDLVLSPRQHEQLRTEQQPPVTDHAAVVGYVAKHEAAIYPVTGVPGEFAAWRLILKRTAQAADIRVSVTRSRDGAQVIVTRLGADPQPLDTAPPAPAEPESPTHRVRRRVRPGLARHAESAAPA